LRYALDAEHRVEFIVGHGVYALPRAQATVVAEQLRLKAAGQLGAEGVERAREVADEIEALLAGAREGRVELEGTRAYAVFCVLTEGIADRPAAGGRLRDRPARRACRVAGSVDRRYEIAVVVVLAVLLVEFGSTGALAVTDAVSVSVPFVAGFTTIVIVADVPFPMFPRLQVTTVLLGFRLQLPLVLLTDPKPALLSNVSSRVTPVAVDGPLFLTMTL
jgi:hypothetical protein